MCTGGIMIKNNELAKRIEALKVQYRNVPDAIEDIESTIQTVLYYEAKGEDKKAADAVFWLEQMLPIGL